MATDLKARRTNSPVALAPFLVRAETEDARGNGVEVVPAQPNKVPYMEGYQIASAVVAEVRVGHSAGSAGKTAIGVVEYMTAKSTTGARQFYEPMAGAVGQNIGIHSTAAGHVEAVVWGYYAAP